MASSLPPSSLSFNAHVVPGAGRGKKLGTPTLNLDLADVPPTLQEGIYACFVQSDESSTEPVYRGALHYGPRPVFKDSVSCEVHIIDLIINVPPLAVTITIIKRLRGVQDFPSPEDLQTQILLDIEQAKAVLNPLL